MLSLKFPPLEKLLAKDTTELDPDNPRNGVCVYNENAIIVQEQWLLMFNLSDYFINTMAYTSDKEIRDLAELMEFMHGKMFSSAFWKELTQTSFVSITHEGISLDGVIRKDIHYKEKFFDDSELRMICMGMAECTPTSKKVNAVNVAPLLSILGTLRPLVKNDTIVLRTVGEATPIQFTFDGNPWIYGVLFPEISVSSKNFMFDQLENFSRSFK